jgi:hypothetical protein
MDSDLEQLAERIAGQASHLDAAMYRFLTDLREFDERGGWHTQGALSCAHWLAWRVGLDLVTGRERVRVARKLGEFAVIGDALRRGEVSYSKVRALVRVATPENEALLLDHARLMTASQLEKLSRKYAFVQPHGQDPHPLGDAQRRCVRRRDTEDGMVKIEAILHPEEAELVWTMINHAPTQLNREPVPPASSDSAEAGAAAQAPKDACTRSARLPRMPVMAGSTIPRKRMRRRRHPGTGAPRRLRPLRMPLIAGSTIPRKRRQSVRRHQRPGRVCCTSEPMPPGAASTVPTRWCRSHRGISAAIGPSVRRSRSRSRLHHRHVHEYGYTIELGEDQRPQFRCSGSALAVVPSPAGVADLEWPAIRAVNESPAIDANTIACEWDGRPVDYGTIVGHLATVDGLR